MLIAETFYSIQGEGILAGAPSAFIRTSGCNLRCAWCDTGYTSWDPEGVELSIDAILERLLEMPTRHVVATGGEPLIATGIEDLCSALRERRYHITIETAATVFKPLACDLASLSPKLSSSTPWERDGGKHAESHENRRVQLDVIQQFMDAYPYQLKFVMDRPGDVDEVLRILEQLKGLERQRVLLMPQGVTSEEIHSRAGWIAEACKGHGFRYCPRLHIDIWGNMRGV
jgi:7-carboxy-7-deazaguanine synthase